MTLTQMSLISLLFTPWPRLRLVAGRERVVGPAGCRYGRVMAALAFVVPVPLK
ncbi:MAG: hypothetical protein Ct9H300mP12_06080 [Acidimicrobiales bacterium]|nr:MAG: hypothetical protein Ct9H300mP12_06080 [Acidimicrobiales bacterium]